MYIKEQRTVLTDSLKEREELAASPTIARWGTACPSNAFRALINTRPAEHQGALHSDFLGASP